jgi:preprotein translocase subunit SecA
VRLITCRAFTCAANAQKQPKQEYKREAFELFGNCSTALKNEVTKILMTVKIQSGEQLEQAFEEEPR